MSQFIKPKNLPIWPLVTKLKYIQKKNTIYNPNPSLSNHN